MDASEQFEDQLVEGEISHALQQLVDSYANLAEAAARHTAKAVNGAQRLRSVIESFLSSQEPTTSDGTNIGARRVIAAAIEALSDDAESPTMLSQRAIRIDHVAIAVQDLDLAIESLSLYGFTVVERREVSGEKSGMHSATVQAGGVTFVLCQGNSPKSNVSQYIEAYGPGVQHLAVQIAGLEPVVMDLKNRGADLLPGFFRAPGLHQVFTRRNPATGMQFEFLERIAASGFDDSNVRELFTAMEREGEF